MVRRMQLDTLSAGLGNMRASQDPPRDLTSIAARLRLPQLAAQGIAGGHSEGHGQGDNLWDEPDPGHSAVLD